MFVSQYAIVSFKTTILLSRSFISCEPTECPSMDCFHWVQGYVHSTETCHPVLCDAMDFIGALVASCTLK